MTVASATPGADRVVKANGSGKLAAGWIDVSTTLALYVHTDTVAPTVNEDGGDGYIVGSRWIDTVTDKEYVCTDITLGAAVWVDTSITRGTQTANRVFAGPGSGAAAVPTFRALVADDVPAIPASKITSGTLAVAQGGTNAATAVAARTNLGIQYEQWPGLVETPSAKTYRIILKSVYALTIESLTIMTVSGTCTVAVKIDGVDVTSLSAVAVTNVEQEVAASGANAVAAGADVTIVVSAPAAAVDLHWNLKTARA